MTIYNKPAVLPAWAEDKVGVPADFLQPVDADIKVGWPLSAIPPSRQRFNWLLNYAANAIRYFMQRGLPAYDAAEDYPLHARVQDASGNEYRCIQAGTNHTPATSPTWWKLVPDKITRTGVAGGTVDAITVDFVPDLGTLADGDQVLIQHSGANTVAFTINADAGGAKSVYKGSNSPVVAGDIPGADFWGRYIYDASLNKWQMLNPSATAATGFGQAQLSKSGDNLILLPKNGNRILVNGVACTVPAAGVTLAPPAVASTVYYIYAVATAGAISSLEASATVPVTDTTAGANQGVEIKTDDVTRSLVGIARTASDNAWADTATQRFVESWFNPVERNLSGAFTAQRSTGSATPIELNTEIRVEWVTFGRHPVHFIGGGTISSNSSGNSSYGAVAIDSTTVPASTVVTVGTNLYTPLAAPTFKTVAAGYHYATMLGWASSTTGFYGNGTNHNNLEGVVL